MDWNRLRDEAQEIEAWVRVAFRPEEWPQAQFRQQYDTDLDIYPHEVFIMRELQR